jgi:hypothetical protein
MAGRAADAKYCPGKPCRQKAYRRRRKADTGAALLVRHERAMGHVWDINDPRWRSELLFAVVWPDLWWEGKVA